jgi:hypothetical protein
MRNRCDPQHEFAKHYFERGIKVCERWQSSFENFLADVGRRPSPAHSLDRIDNDGDYEPGNVRWATATEQVRNRRGVQRFELDGENLTLAEWAERKGVRLTQLEQRVRKYGWSLAEALETSVARTVTTRDLRQRWYQIVSRCTDPEHERFADYGGRGIAVCVRWRGSFEAFAEDVGLPSTPEEYSLDRIDNERGYEPGNIRWTTPLAQNRNRRSTQLFEIDGQKRLMIDWCRLARMDYGTVKRRMHVGWSIEEALGTPRDAGRSPKNRRAWRPAAVLARFNGSCEKWTSLSKDEQDKLVDDAINTYRAAGFPWSALDDDTPSPLRAVASAKVTVKNDVVVSVSSAGQKTCTATHKHRLEARHKGQPSIVEAFKNDRILERALRYQLKRGDPITPQRLLRALAALVRAPRNFPPALARWIVDEYAPDGGTVLDPCSGYGGRMLGALASHHDVTYIGADIDSRSVEANVKFAVPLKREGQVRQYLRAVEDSVAWPAADLVLTGPPYFDLEDYGTGSAYQTYEAWRDGFLRVLVEKSLRAAPVVVLNVAEVALAGGRRDIPGDVVALAAAAGGRLDRMILWPLRAFGKKGREEKLLVFRR